MPIEFCQFLNSVILIQTNEAQVRYALGYRGILTLLPLCHLDVGENLYTMHNNAAWINVQGLSLAFEMTLVDKSKRHEPRFEPGLPPLFYLPGTY